MTMLGRIFFTVLTIVAASCQETREKATTEVTSFSCEGRVTGYYADVDTGCKKYHYCFGSQQYTYECPNNTLFQQRIFICNHWYLVDCDNSEKFYTANLLIGQRDKPFVEEGDDDGQIHTTYSVPYTTPYTTPRPSSSESTEGYNYDYDDVLTGSITPEIEDFQRVESPVTEPPTTKTTTTTTTTATTKKRNREGKSDAETDDHFIRLKFSDPRGLFYIPNENNSVEAVAASFRELVIPRFSNEVEVMQFKEQSVDAGDFACPKYCDRRFLKVGTCHPCVMIK